MTCGVYEIVTAAGERYIGSSVDIKRRFRQHRVDLRNGKHRNAALQAAYNNGSKLEFRVLERCDKSVVRQREQHHMDTTECINTDRNCLSDPIEISEERKKNLSEKAKVRNLGNTYARKEVYIKWSDGTEKTFANTVKASEAIRCSSSLVRTWCRGESTTYLKRGIDEIRYA